MKKSLILLPMAAVLLTLTGCKKDNEKSGPSGETVTLSATLGGGEKTEIYDGTKMRWSEGDKVNINGTDYTATFPFDDGTHTQASFVGVERADDGKYVAIYPASLYKSGSYVLPSTQTYNAANYNILSGISPMYAVTETTELQFHNICALVKLQVKGEGTVKKIVVSSDNSLCGEFTVVKNSDKYHAVISPSEGGKTLTLNCGTGVELSDEPTTFYIALPQGPLGNLTFKIGKSTSAAVNANLTAGKLYAKSMSDVVVVSTPGALDGEFTINEAGDKVNFSQGNLQCVRNGSTWDNECTWRFAEDQWDYVAKNGSVSADYADKDVIDLFGWGTSGYAPSGDDTYVHYQPWSTDKTTTGHDDTNNPYGYGPAYNASTNFLTGASDWGYNAISNGGNRENAGWRTLTSSEWEYLFSRSTTYGPGRRYAEVKVNGKAGILLFPDDFSSWPAGAGNEPTKFNSYSSNWNGVNYSVAQFNVLQTAGCVFLPAAGYRSGTSVYFVGSYGYYWSSTPNGAAYAFNLRFLSGIVNPANYNSRYNGFSVRLVLPVEN